MIIFDVDLELSLYILIMGILEDDNVVINVVLFIICLFVENLSFVYWFGFKGIDIIMDVIFVILFFKVWLLFNLI